MYHEHQPNVGRYAMHGCYGLGSSFYPFITCRCVLKIMSRQGLIALVSAVISMCHGQSSICFLSGKMVTPVLMQESLYIYIYDIYIYIFIFTDI